MADEEPAPDNTTATPPLTIATPRELPASPTASARLRHIAKTNERLHALRQVGV